MSEQRLTSGEDGEAIKAARLDAFRGPVERRDLEMVEYWRGASAAEHAAAMIDLANTAEQIVVHTGYGKDPDEHFPGFPALTKGGRSHVG